MVMLLVPERHRRATTGRLDGVQLRMTLGPGGKIETLTTFFGGQGTINVNSWSPDSKKFAYVIYEAIGH